MHFSDRTSWNLEHNEFAELLAKYKADKVDFVDLTVSNPTQCGFSFYTDDLLDKFQCKDNLSYVPRAFGSDAARRAVADYYQDRGYVLDYTDICLTSSTSEAYTYLFKLLADNGDEVLYPQPSYPLFQFLGDINDVEMTPYPLTWHDGVWTIDFDALEAAITEKTRTILIVNPNNPTGSYIKPQEISRLNDICQRYDLSVISDDVFNDFNITDHAMSLIDQLNVPTFILNGLSKVLGLPQMKLAWIVCRADNKQRTQIMNRLEMIADTYLSLNTPVQNALPGWLKRSTEIQTEIRQRITTNFNELKKMASCGCLDVLDIEGGWSAVIRLKDGLEGFAFNLLKSKRVYVHPPYFYDFSDERMFVISLLTPLQKLKEGIKRIEEYYLSDNH